MLCKLYSPETAEETAQQERPEESEKAGEQTKQAVQKQRRYQSFLPAVHVGQTSPKVRSQEHP